MFIKPELGGRIFWGLAGFSLIVTACAGLSVPMPGILLTCLGFPLAIFSFGYAFGAAITRIDDDGIFQRNFFFLPRKFTWNEIESGKITTDTYDHKDSSGWTSRPRRTYVLFVNNEGKNIFINAKSSGPEEWWDAMRRISKEKMGDKFDG